MGGPIGFIGIIVPHLVRLMVGADHRIVLPASALFGAAFLVGCDILARTVMAPVELPVGVITALIGGPFFLWLLIRRTMSRSRGRESESELDSASSARRTAVASAKADQVGRQSESNIHRGSDARELWSRSSRWVR